MEHGWFAKLGGVYDPRDLIERTYLVIVPPIRSRRRGVAVRRDRVRGA